MNLSELLTKPQQYAVVSILIKIMEADGIIDPNEIRFMNQVLEEFQISEQEMELLDSFDILTSVSALRGLDSAIKDAVIKVFVGMAECDGYADPRELEVIRSLEI